MSAHTPGPWEVWVGHAEVYAGPAKENTERSIRGHRRVVAEASEHDDDESDGDGVDYEREANARLISAAPDLLAALEEQVAEFDKRLREYVENDDPGIAEIAMAHHGARMDRARAAIAKAKVLP